MATYRQHFLPRFMLKKWSINNLYNTFDLENLVHKKYNIKNYKNDPFHKYNFYENLENYQFNEIENKLSIIENEFIQLLKKIEGKNETINLNRYETKFLRLYSLIDNYRSNNTLYNSIHLKGGTKYNEYYSKKEKLEIKNEFLDQLNYLLDDIYNFNKNNVNLLNDELQQRLNEKIRLIQSSIEKNISIDEIPEFNKDFKDRLVNNIIDLYTFNTKFIKIPENIESNFLLTDGSLIEYYGNNESKKKRIPILILKVVNPKLAIAYINLEMINIIAGNHSIIKNSFWDKMFPNLFIKDNTVDMINGNNILSNEDKYTFKIYNLNNENQVNLINGMNLSQASKHVVYKNLEDYKNAKKAIKDNNIIRIESLGL